MKLLVGALMFALISGFGVAQNPGNNNSPTTQSAGTGARVQKQPVKSEKKLKGCIQSGDGKYLLKEDRGKTVVLGGSQELPSHVGQRVTVHGNYMSEGNAAMSGGSPGSGSAFMVSKIDTVSSSCGAGMDKGNKEHDNEKPSPGHK